MGDTFVIILTDRQLIFILRDERAKTNDSELTVQSCKLASTQGYSVACSVIFAFILM